MLCNVTTIDLGSKREDCICGAAVEIGGYMDLLE